MRLSVLVLNLPNVGYAQLLIHPQQLAIVRNVVIVTCLD